MKNVSTTHKSDVDIDLKNYRIQEKIGEGGYGKVFKAEQISTGQTVAIKMLKFKDTLSEQSKKQHIARFERETQLCVQINHPNIVTLLDKGYTIDEEPYAVFEYISGETLKDLINRTNGLSAEETGVLMEQVLDALECAHAKGIIHRDLKPHNIMVTKRKTKSYVKILDFGMGTFSYDFKSDDYKDLTLTQEVIGTPAYSAPEQLRGEPPTVKSDLYAWGLIFLECLTGQPVMKGTSVAEIFQQQLNAVNVPLPPSIMDHPIAKILNDVLHKDPRQRIHNAEMISEAFAEINLSTIVGQIQPQNTIVQPAEDATQINQFAWLSNHSEKRQLTVLCAKLNLSISGKSALDIETLEAIQKDQLHLCKDMGVRFGAHISGTMADTIIMYFGYPQVSDNDARRAGRTALELISQLQKRSALLYAQHRIKIDIRVAINSGTVLIKHKSAPEGLVTNTAFNLLYETQPGHILVGETTKKLLDPYLEFEPHSSQGFSGSGHATSTFLLTGERPAEALSNLSLRSAEQKMIGRETEQQQVLEAWESIVSANGKTVLIKGQAGIGKSKLIYETKKQIINEEFLVRECRCLPEYQNNALYPIFEMLKKDAEIHEDITDSIPQLQKVLQKAGCDPAVAIPVLCSWFSIPLGDSYPTSDASPLEQKEILFDTLEKWILSIDTQQKFMLIVEDLHWIDPTSLEFLNILVAKNSTQNYFLLLTARPEFTTDWTEEQVTTIVLDILNKTYTESLIKDLIHQKPIETKALGYIVERSDGIPLFIEDLTSMLLEQDYLVLDNGTYQLAEKFDTSSVPVTLKGLLNTRLGRTGFAKETAQLAAAIGREFTYDLLVKASMHDEAMVQGNLNVLQEANLIYRQRRVHNEIYIFRHALIRDAAYESMVSQLKKEVHSRIAEAIENNFKEIIKENPFELARHQAEAGQYEKASFYGLRSISDTLKKSSYLESINQSNIVIEWTREIQIKTSRIESELRINQYLVQALIAIKGFAHEEVKLVNDRSEELSLLLPDSSNWLLNILWTRIQFNLMSADYSKYEPLWIKAEKDALELNHKTLLVALYGINGYKNWLFGKYKEAEKNLNKSIEIYDDINGKDVKESFGIDYKVYCYLVLANVYAFIGDFNKSDEFGDEGIEMAESLNDAHTKAYALSLYISLYFYRGEDERIKKVLKDNTDFLVKHNFTTFLYLFETLSGLVNDDIHNSMKYRDLIGNTGVKAAGTYYSLIVAQTAYNCGQYKTSLQIIEDNMQDAKNSGEVFQLPDFYRLKAMCLSKLTKSNKEINQNFDNGLEFAKKDKTLLYQLRILVDYYKTTNSLELKNKCIEEMRLLQFKVNEQKGIKQVNQISEILINNHL
ncbi:TOMM system kinase/cyclase fusion protein [Aquimarina algiphila]|uniref:TOMM system kinase/cyclase fusion protein n=1 Tax=Aquimarina algiphila TaxID=2047982 RepID=A0A554VCZ3_9FLAO|nr:TOMM system kinase/cyclase fusion protein [Aquimarina algiphila]TSE04657.1 TOMM system kinase/cyclase fusion protein [Aquimarina algiphila]